MREDQWAPLYEAILADFGFSRRDDERARDALDAMLARRPPADTRAFEAALRGREAWVVGPALRSPGALPRDAPLLVTDGAAGAVLPAVRAAAIVTDLDGDVAAQQRANAEGAVVFVHAHGDNLDALARHLDGFAGTVVGTTQAAARGRVRAYGGFTDGDRAACIAAALGARAVALAGFDFARPAAKPGADPARKLRKLAWARRVLDALDVPVRLVDA